jgi:CRISPR-associated protein Cas5t
MLWVDIQAPFAACRPLVAGWYRPTAGFLTHSAVYGLLLNIAGRETRLWEHEEEHRGKVSASLTRTGLPRFHIALGLPLGFDPPAVETMFQQLHNYPVGSQSGIDPTLAKGRKNNIAPVRRELLCGVRALAVIDADPDLENDIRLGLAGRKNEGRYGLPFLGDNNFTLDRLEEVSPRPARWYTLVANRAGGPREGTTRLTVHIDRADMSGTRSALFAPETEPGDQPPDRATVPMGDPIVLAKWLEDHSRR